MISLSSLRIETGLLGRRQRELAATLVIQRCYRAYLKRMYAHAERQARIALEKLQAKAGSLNKCLCEVSLSKSAVYCRISSARIKTSHDVLLKERLEAPQSPTSATISRPNLWFERT